METLSACTQCEKCVAACPEQVVRLAPDGVALDTTAGECTFCGSCADACPEAVFGEQKTMSHVMEISGDCLAQAGVTCMTCRDACPEDAILMQPRIGVPFLPSLDAARCTGCAACVSVCPAEAIRPIEKEPEDG
ncbi:ferredoxin-type protein NapF [Sulfitobacter aestuarii]|uniref:Ferredoxin-type protein NapF n=1 Tax=Sulfitobacter aestuarii TaxID=2161676 RepID=A0ABW5U787_9RHOB